MLFPELAVTGYPPEDLLLRPAFIRAARRSVDEIAARTRGITALVGAPHLDADLYNACYVLADGEIRGVYRKRFLPNYGVFDEDRYFAPGRDLLLLRFGDVLIGPTICEDIWQPGPPATDLALAGAQLVANISASPFHVGKDREREEMLRVRARDNSCFVALCNAVGGQDELIFDGHSVVLDDEGEVIARAPGFEEALLVVDVDPVAAVGRRLRDVRRRALAQERADPPAVEVIELTDAARAGRAAPPGAGAAAGRPRADAPGARARPARLRREERLRPRRDRPLRRDRLGADGRARGRGDRRRSRARRLDAVALLVRGHAGRRACGSPTRSASTSASCRSSRSSRRSPTCSRRRSPAASPTSTEENLQARIRGTLLMALSNKFGWLVIATGNKSELSVGYSTLYGDLAGGFALLKDVFKTDVFRLARRLNERAGPRADPAVDHRPRPVAPSCAPTSSTRTRCRRTPKLDEVLEAYVELDRSREELAQDGFEPDVVERALAMIDRAEYKRRQAPPGVKLRPKAFGRDRRTPITNRWPG